MNEWVGREWRNQTYDKWMRWKSVNKIIVDGWELQSSNEAKQSNANEHGHTILSHCSGSEFDTALKLCLQQSRNVCEVKISEGKYVATNDKQWWWAGSINIIMQWNHNILIYQCWKWSNWAKLITRNVMWREFNQWSIIAERQIVSAAKWNRSRRPKIERKGGTNNEEREEPHDHSECNAFNCNWIMKLTSAMKWILKVFLSVLKTSQRDLWQEEDV